MCLIPKKGCWIATANEDIKCWKVVSPRIYFVDERQSIYQGTYHKFEEVLEACEHLRATKVFENNKPYRQINEGFHAYLSIERAARLLYYDKTKRVVECTIPKGAEYCYGTFDDIVANKMIVHKHKTE